MRGGLVSALFAVLIGSEAKAQTLTFANGATWDVCAGTIVDSGGDQGPYGNNEDLTATLCPTGGSGSDPFSSVKFTSWSVQPGTADQLFIYNGPTIASPLLATGNGSNSLLNQTFTATGVSRCLTFRWVSDASVTADGWEASILTGPDAGANGSIALCSNSAAVQLFNSLGGTPDPGGTWTAPGGGASTGTFTPGTSTPGAYTYTLAGTGSCASAAAVVTVSVSVAPNAGSNGTLNVCSNAAAIDLFTVLGGSPNVGGSWTGPGGGVVSNTFTPGTSPQGTYTYTVAGVPPCTSASATVQVTQVAAPNAGLSRAITVCSSDAPFAMIGQLLGSPQAGGSWTGPGGAAHGLQFNPATDVSGAYTYTVLGTAPCANATATLTVTVRQAPVAGTNGTITVCSTDADFDLIDQLGGAPDITGTWTKPGGAPHSGIFQPGTDVAGIYTYTVVGQAPCANATATVTVTVSTAPNAGTSANVVRCSDAANFSLFTQLGGSPNAGGSWTGPLGGAHSVTFDPGVDQPGIYTYTVTGTAPCANATATVNVTIITAPQAGTNGTRTVCSSDAAFNLLTVLGGTPDASGGWTDPLAQSFNGTFVPGTSAAGVYTYTVTGIAPCVNDVATATITVSQAANVGTNGSLTVCSDDAPVVLFGSLGGSPNTGGSWTKPGGGSFAGTYDPANPAHPVGIYTYTVTPTAPCAALSSTVQVVENQAPKAGVDGTITVCSTNAPFNLITALGGGPDLNGSWLGPTLQAVPSIFTPGTSAPGQYRYVVPGTAPCENDTAFVTVVVNTAPWAGTNGSLNICSSASSVNLFTLLGGSPNSGGTWTNPNSQPFGGTYDPSDPQHPEGAYTYTVTGLSPCANATAFVVVNEERQPVAGSNGTISVCSDASPFDLFDELGGNPDNGGTWTAPGGGAVSGVCIPGTSAAGVYTYTVTGTAPCTNAASTVTVTINQAPFAGNDGNVTVCSDQVSVDLFAVLGGGPDAGGTWNDLDNTGQMSGQFFSPLGLPPGSYDFSYTVPGSGQCNSDHAEVTVTIVPDLDAGTNGTLTVCSSNTQVNLFSGLGGSPQPGGTWADLSATGALSGQFFNASIQGAGSFNFQYTLTGTLACATDQANVTVNVVDAPDAGSNGTAVFCSTGSAASLFPFLLGSPVTGGSWTRNGNPVSGIYNPVLDSPGVYTYTVSGTPPCANATATVTVSEVPAANAGCPAQITRCSTDASFSMTTALGCNPSPVGTWTDPLGQPHGNTFVPGLDPAGVYIYSVAGTAPCGPATSTLTITVNPAAFAGNDVSSTVCSNGSPFLLFSVLTGGPNPSGTWKNPSNQPFPSGLYTPGVSTPGVYTYTVVGQAPCVNDISTVTVFEVPQADAGNSASVTLCAGGAAVNLFTFLTGAPTPTGTWTTSGGQPFSGIFIPGTTPPGAYTYTVVGVPPCANDQATVTVAVNPTPNAGISSTRLACSNESAFALIDQLGGSPQLNGTWTAPGGGSSTGVFTPGTSTPGTYVYSVPGQVPCAAATASVTVVVNPAANAGTNGTLTLCSTSGATNLFLSLGGSPQLGGTWRKPGNIPHSGIFQSSIDPPGVYNYTVPGVAPCTTATASVTVSVNQVPNAGSNGLVAICDNTTPFPLINVLTGSPQLNGTWTNPLGVAHTGVFIPGVDPPGPYTYTVPGLAPCANATAIATVIQNSAPDAGTDGIVTACSDQQAFLLIDELGGTPDGSGAWTAPGGGAFSGVFVPGTSLAGVYSYIVPGSAPCVNDTSRVTVVENLAPDAGVSNAQLICSDQGPLSLVDLLAGDPDLNGTWTGPGNVPFGPVFDPATDVSGTYTYTVVGFAPCVNDVAAVQITLITAPNAGSDGAVASCVNNPAIDLFPALGGSPQLGGTWTNDNNVGSLVGGTFNSNGVAQGTYTFTYTLPGTAPCAAATSVVTVSLSNALDAGQDNSVQACESEFSVVLFTQLGGTPQGGGGWLDVDNSGALSNGNFNANQAGVGVYRFTYIIAGSANCLADSATVTVEVLEGPYAGNDGFSSLCSSSGQVNLFTLLGGGPDAGGTWTDPSNAVTDEFFEPGTDAAGAYTYTVPAIGNCAADQSVVTMQVTQAPNAGDPGAVTVCSNGTTINLFLQLQGTPQAGGTWTGPGGTPHPNTYNPAVDGPGVYTYTVTGQNVCQDDEAVVVVSENPAPFAGLDNSIAVCSDALSFQMVSQLAGNPQNGGTWTGPGSQPHGPGFNPAVDVGGIYTYTVTGLAPCAADVATLTIQLTTAPEAGVDSTLSVCSTNTGVDLSLALGAGADAGGAWTDVNTSGALTGSVFNATLVPAGTYSFIYTVPGSGPCTADDATVTVVVSPGGDPGIGGTDTICGGLNAYDLFNSLSGTPDAGGTWADVLGTGALTDNFLNASLLPSTGQYPFTYTVTVPGCGDATSLVYISVTPFPDPGGDTTLAVCSSSEAFDLFTVLGGTPEPGGVWTNAGGTSVSSTFDPAADPSGTFLYTLPGNGVCNDTLATVIIVVNYPPIAGADAQVALCNADEAYLLISALPGASINGTWTDLDNTGALVNGSFNVLGVDPGAYDFMYVVPTAGCPSDTAYVSTTVSEPVTVSDTIITCIAEDRTYTIAFTLSGGVPSSYSVTGVPGTLTSTAPYIFTSVPLLESQSYEIVVTDVNGCAPDTILGVSGCDYDAPIYVPESFSPNGDGVNDVLVIPGIEGFAGNTVSIFNRWGSEVYKAAGYDNRSVRWDGSSEKVVIPGGLPTGTYYYVVELGDGSEVYKGFIYLNR